MAEENRFRMKSKQIVYSSDDEPGIRPEKTQEKQTTTATITASSTTVVTKTLLDDANNGYKNGNFACSPLSLDILLGMLAAGAEGETLKQLLVFLGHESIDKFLSQSPSSILLKQILSNLKTGLPFSLANGVWVDRRAEPIQSSYQKVLETVYRTEARSVDFRDKVKCGEEVDKINSWVHNETKGLIPTIVEKHELSQDSVMVIANALYFKGEWANPFYAHETKDKDFSLITGENVSVPFMTSNKEFEYGSFKGYKMIKIPYESNKLGKSNKFSMYIFLPHKKAGLKKLLQMFHSNDALIHGKFDLARVWFDKLWIPKFKISCTFEAKDVMKQMGLTLPFEEMNEELSGIVDLRSLFENTLYVSKILQKSFIEVDEKGTIAAAISCMECEVGADMSDSDSEPPPPPNFVADHPFMFMIREDSSQAVLFVGVVLNPLVDN